MPDLKSSLEAYDSGFLKILSELWGLELIIKEKEASIPVIINAIKTKAVFQEIIETAPDNAKLAIQDLIKNQGKIPWAQFCRQFGDVRIMGPGKLEREKPFLHPLNATEWLWYRGIIFRAFFNQSPEPQEFAYLPDECYQMLNPSQKREQDKPKGHPFTKNELKIVKLSSDQILDHACTLMAALRAGIDIEKHYQSELPVDVLIELLRVGDILDSNLRPEPEKTRIFLETTRFNALKTITNGWLISDQFNELSLISEIVCEGKWKNNPLLARQFIIDQIKQIPIGQWWDLASFIKGIHIKQPEFQRLSGDYDSWFIRDRNSGKYLHGFENWDAVEGRLIHFTICTMLFWLGLVDLASDEENSLPCAFRLTTWANALLNNQTLQTYSEENEKITIQSNGKIQIPRLAPRVARYQISRFCDWEGINKETFLFRITASSLKRAIVQNLQISQLISLFQKYGKKPISLSIIKTLSNWEKNNQQAHFEKGILLRVTEPSIIIQLEKSRAKRYLLEQLTSTIVLIKPGGENVVQQVLTELGYLADFLPTL